PAPPPDGQGALGRLQPALTDPARRLLPNEVVAAARGVAVLPRTTSSVGRIRWRALFGGVAWAPSSAVISSSAAARPLARESCCTVVSAGRVVLAIGLSSKPTTEM